MTLDIFFVEMPEGGWIAKCEDHAAWRFNADTFDEAKAKAKAPTSLKRHHSRQLQFRFFIVGSVGT